MNLPQFLRSLGKEEIKPGGSYASKTAIAKLELRSNERVLVVGPGAASTAMYVALTSRVNASSLLSNQGERVDCDDTQLMRRLADAVGTVETIPFENGTFDAALVEATLADLELVRRTAELYLRSGHGEHEHAALTRALARARETAGEARIPPGRL